VALLACPAVFSRVFRAPLLDKPAVAPKQLETDFFNGLPAVAAMLQ
jgi:hypothetical protein